MFAFCHRTPSKILCFFKIATNILSKGIFDGIKFVITNILAYDCH